VFRFGMCRRGAFILKRLPSFKKKSHSNLTKFSSVAGWDEVQFPVTNLAHIANLFVSSKGD
ncbi:MAG TPA: hypothetical protein PLU80_11700, partial [Acidobacteriota bacterium]|nr:hypothetical protein [Acidobacteriota bacterium]